jgi:outer membrane beta-barrel protein
MALVFAGIGPMAHAASSGNSNNNSNSTGDDVDVSKLKQRYWQQNNSSDVSVVQNRTFKMDGRLELSVFGGFVFNDPFLSVNNFGGTIGYHLSEYVSIHMLAWKYLVSNSSAYNTLLSTQSVAANTNAPNSFYAGEVHGSFLYGKLSLAGEVILHYDLHLIAGAGVTNTANGSYFTPDVGIGQQLFLGDHFSFNIDFRETPYHENIVSSDAIANPGQVVDSRENWSSAITLGFSLFL